MKVVLLSILILLPMQSLLAGAIDGIPCTSSVNRLLKRWASRNEWEQLASEKGKLYQTPTALVGTWIRLEVIPRSPVSVTLTRVEGDEAHFFDSVRCQESWERRPARFASKAWKNQFTDEHLRTLMRQNRQGIIYGWTPHMPLSLEGVKEILAAGKQLGIPVFFALDPHADPDFAEYRARAYQLPVTALMRIESVELFNRGILDHFPAVLVFSENRVAKRLIPGFKKDRDYVRGISQIER